MEKTHKTSTWINLIFWPGYIIDRATGSACEYPKEGIYLLKKAEEQAATFETSEKVE